MTKRLSNRRNGNTFARVNMLRVAARNPGYSDAQEAHFRGGRRSPHGHLDGRLARGCGTAGKPLGCGKRGDDVSDRSCQQAQPGLVVLLLIFVGEGVFILALLAALDLFVVHMVETGGAHIGLDGSPLERAGGDRTCAEHGAELRAARGHAVHCSAPL